MIKLTYKGRLFDARRFAKDLRSQAIEMGMQAIEEKARGAASSIIDPETGRHADVFVDRLPGDKIAICTTGSPAYARLIEERLGVGMGEVKVISQADGAARPKVYLAHASEDKAIVRPIAEYLIARGVDVWFDEWEIELGDSLRQKMEEGLGAMTHFMVILTPNSITKPWVSREIDVGFVGLVGGRNRMVPLRIDLAVVDLPPFLGTLLCEKLDPTSEKDLASLVDRLYGVSRKPALGPSPRYVLPAPAGLSGWSPAAVAIGRHLIEASVNAMPHDPIKTIEELARETGLDLTEVRIAVLDLKEAGYLWAANTNEHVAADRALYVEFDEAFMPFSPSEDARTVANRIVSQDQQMVETKRLAQELGWGPRRMNSTICYLQRAGAIEARHALASTPWRAVQLIVTDRTLRFARNHA